MNNSIVPKISIIVPVYKAEVYLRQCLDSILTQTYTNFELLLINDGSPDHCGDICNEYAIRDSRIRVFHQPNKGVSAARNLGLRMMAGEFVTFIDSDDKVSPDFLSSFHLDVDLSIQGFIVEKKKTTTVRRYKTECVKNNIGVFFCLSDFHSGVWAKLCRTDIIKDKNIIFPEELCFSEDTIFFLNYISYCQSIYISDSCGYIYRDGICDSLSSKRYDIDVLLYKESILYESYEKIFQKNKLYKSFMHEKTMYVISKYYFFNDITDKDLTSKVFLKEIARKHLTRTDKLILSCGIRVFSLFSRFRRRIKIYILKPLLRKNGATLLNI